MATTKQKTKNPHAWFFGIVSAMEDYKATYAKAIREGIIYEYSDGKTDSLKELYEQYPRHYQGMKRALQFEQLNDADKARKRLIAVLFSYLRFIGYSPDMNYVKETARKAGKAESFNSLTLPKLKQLYCIFGEKYKTKSTEWSEDILNQIAASVI